MFLVDFSCHYGTEIGRPAKEATMVGEVATVKPWGTKNNTLQERKARAGKDDPRRIHDENVTLHWGASNGRKGRPKPEAATLRIAAKERRKD